MYQTNKDLHFHTVDYALILYLSQSGGVSGVFQQQNGYGAQKEYLCTGCYHVPRPDVINLAFTIDWSPPADDECDFTCFSGQIINEKMLVLDWMLINQKGKSSHTVSGSSFLYAPSYIDRKEKTLASAKPFPIF